MNHLIQQRNINHKISCDSAGTSSYHIGSPPDRRMAAAAKQRGIVLSGQARQFSELDLDEFDLILAMDRENYQDIMRLAKTENHMQKVQLMCDFCTNHPDDEVPDPYYGGSEGFNYVIRLLLDACEGLLVTIQDDI